MSNSSVQQNYLTTSSDSNFVLGDTITVDAGSLTSMYTISGNTMNTVSFTGGTHTGSNITIGGAVGSGYNWKMPSEFVDSFPDFYRIKKMCTEYPGLEIAFEKFKTTYYLVKDEYDNPKDKK